MTDLYVQSISKGLNAIHIPADHIISQAIIRARELTNVDSFILVTVEARNLPLELKICEMIEADAILTHGSLTDKSRSNLEKVLKKIKN